MSLVAADGLGSITVGVNSWVQLVQQVRVVWASGVLGISRSSSSVGVVGAWKTRAAVTVGVLKCIRIELLRRGFHNYLPTRGSMALAAFEECGPALVEWPEL